jgi:hypothetical protein
MLWALAWTLVGTVSVFPEATNRDRRHVYPRVDVFVTTTLSSNHQANKILLFQQQVVVAHLHCAGELLDRFCSVNVRDAKRGL